MTLVARGAGFSLFLPITVFAACSSAMPPVDTGPGSSTHSIDAGALLDAADAAIADAAVADTSIADAAVAEDASDAAGDTSPPVDAGADTASGGLDCASDLTLGASVTGVFVATSLPSQAGGAIPDGTYVLTEHDYYEADASADAGTVPGSGSQQTILVSGGALKWTAKYTGDVAKTYVATIQITGTSLTLAIVCDPTGHTYMISTGFTAAGGSLQIVGVDSFMASGASPFGAIPEVGVFTHQ